MFYSITQEWLQQTSEISSWRQEEKFHFYKWSLLQECHYHWATEYEAFGFSLCILVFLPFMEILNITVNKRYQFFSVLVDNIHENWIENCKAWFAIHSSTRLSGVKTWKIIIFFHVLLWLFSGLEIINPNLITARNRMIQGPVTN